MMKSNGAVKVSELVAATPTPGHAGGRPATTRVRPKDTQLEFQDFIHSMGRYKWQGLVMAGLIMLAGYFFWANTNRLTYEAKASIMRREPNVGFWFMQPNRTGHRARSFDGDRTFMRSEMLAEVAQKIGRLMTTLDEPSRLQIQAHDSAAPIRLRGSDPAMVASGTVGDRLLEFRRFGLIAHSPPGTWTMRQLTQGRDLPAEFLAGIELQSTNTDGTRHGTIKMLVGWNAVPGRELTDADLDAARLTVQKRIDGATDFHATAPGPLSEIVPAKLRLIGVDDVAISHATDAVGPAVSDPSALVFSFETAESHNFSAQIVTRDCNFIFTSRLPKSPTADVMAHYQRFLQFLLQLRFSPIQGLGPAFNDNTDLIDALLRDSSVAMESSTLNWLAIDYTTGRPTEPQSVFDSTADVLVVQHDFARVLLNAFHGDPGKPLPEESPLALTEADREAIRAVLAEPTASFIQRINVEGERSSGRLDVRVTHPNRNVAVFLANLVPVAFIATNARLAMQQARQDVAVHHQHLEKARANLRNAQNYLAKLRRDADHDVLGAMVYGLYPAVDMSEGDLRRVVGQLTAELQEREIRARALQGEIRALIYRVALLQFPSDAELAARFSVEDEPIWLPSRDPVVADIDRRISDLQLQVERLAIDANPDGGLGNPILVRRQKEVEALIQYRDEIAKHRRDQFDREMADLRARRDPRPQPAESLEALIDQRNASLAQAKQTAQEWADRVDRAANLVFEKGTATLKGAWEPDARLQIDEGEHRLPGMLDFDIDPKNTLAVLSEQDLRRQITNLETSLTGWKTLVMRKVDIDAQLRVLPRVATPVEAYRFEVNGFETNVRQIAQQMQESRFGATRLPDDYEWQHSADPRTIATRDSSLWLVIIAIGAVIGGIYFTRLWDLMDSRVKTDTQAKEIANLPVLGHLPVLPPSQRYLNTSGMGRGGMGHLASNLFGILGVNLRRGRHNRPEKSICVTSAVPKEGKSLVAYNLAAYYALEGFNTCLLIADVRNPALEIFPDLDTANLRGFMDHFVDPKAVPLDGCVYPTDFAKFSVCFPGQADLHPVRVFDDTRFPAFLTALEQRFEVVVIDAPPVIPVADSTLLANYARAVVVVAALGRVTKRDLSETLDRLRFADAPLVGMVINRDSAARQRAYYYYYAQKGAKVATTPAAIIAADSSNGSRWAASSSSSSSPSASPQDDIATFVDDPTNRSSGGSGR